MHRTLPITASLLFLASFALAGETPKGPWGKFGAGSWVHTKTSSKTEVPGVEIPAQVSEMRQTLVKVTDTEYTMKTETKEGDTWTVMGEMAIPLTGAEVPGEKPKTEDLGTEKVIVEGKDFTAKKTRITGAGTTTTTWADDQTMLKSETQMPGGGTSVMETTALAKKVKVGDKELVCRETKTVTKMQGSETTMVTLVSDAVPGMVVRSEMSSSMAGAKTSSVTELVAFEGK